MVEPGTQYRETKVVPKDWKRHVKITQGLYQRESKFEAIWALKRRVTVTDYNTLMIPGVCSKAKKK